MTTPSVTAVIATRDRPAMLRTAIQSVLGQDYAGVIDVIVVFDGAPVDHEVADIAPGRIRTVANDRTPGLAGARNVGLLAATGTYVGFCDDDDRWVAGKVRRQVALLESVPWAVVAAAGSSVHHGARRFVRLAPAGPVTFRDLLRDRTAALHPSTFLARRDAVLKRVGLVDEQCPGGYGEDYDWLLRAARSEGLIASAEPLADVTWHSGSYYSGRWPATAEGLAWLIERYPEFGDVPRGAARIHGQLSFALAASGRRREAARSARTSIGLSVREPRSYLALGVAAGLLRPDWVLHRLNAHGRGI